MTAYATVADLTTYGIPAAALESVDTAAQQAAVTAACGIADSYLRGRFTLPLTAWDTTLTQYVAQIAAWNVLRVRGFMPGGADEAVRSGYKDAISWFASIARGEVTPVVTDSGGTPTSSGYSGPFAVQGQLSDDGVTVVASPSGRSRGWR